MDTLTISAALVVVWLWVFETALAIGGKWVKRGQ